MDKKIVYIHKDDLGKYKYRRRYMYDAGVSFPITINEKGQLQDKALTESLL
ncbi:MAG: hypothetical protein ACTHLL_04535 [Candidatus Nitrosocosmicus sp.]